MVRIARTRFHGMQLEAASYLIDGQGKDYVQSVLLG